MSSLNPTFDALIARGIAIVALSVSLSLACPALAAGDPQRSAEGRHTRWISPTGRIALTLPVGGRVAHQRFVDAGPARIAETAAITIGDDEVLKLDLFTNPGRLSAAAWLRGEQAFLRSADAQVRPARRRHPSESAIELWVPATPQVAARCITLVASRSVLVRVTSEGCAKRPAKTPSATPSGHKYLHRSLLRRLRLPPDKAAKTPIRRGSER